MRRALLLRKYSVSTRLLSSASVAAVDDRGYLVDIASAAPTVPFEKYDPTLKTGARYNPYDIVDESLAVMSANLRLGETLRAESIFHKLWNSNFANFRSKVGIQTINALIEAYLQLNTIGEYSFLNQETALEDVEKALELYAKIPKYQMKPDENTFAILCYYFTKKSDFKTIATLFKEMRSFGLDPKQLSSHSRFEDPADSLMLKRVFNHFGIEQAALNEIPDEQLLISALEDVTQESKPTKNTEMALDSSANSTGVKLLRKTLSKMSDFLVKNTELEKIQHILEDECKKLALMEQDERLESIPDYLKQMTGVSKTLLQEWHKELVPLLKREMSLIKKKSLKTKSEFDNFTHLPFFNLLKPQVLAVITITEFLRAPYKVNSETMSGFFGESVASELYIRIGNAVEQEANAQHIYLQKTKTEKDKLYALHASGKLRDPKLRQAAFQMARAKLGSSSDWTPKWPDSLLVKVGSVLASHLISVAKINVETQLENGSVKIVKSPAFEIYQSNQPNKYYKIVKFNEQLLKDLLQSEASVPPRYLPMVIPPRQWVSWRDGGYFTERTKASMVRVGKNHLHSKYLDAADKKGHLDVVYHALDILGLTPWRVNQFILSVAKICWNQGTEYPYIESSKPLPLVGLPKDQNDPMAMREYKRASAKRALDEQARYSQRCDAHYKIMVADAFKDTPIYFPHYIDFRGRAYPLPVHLNHVGNDLCRGLLQFDKAKPLGEDGLMWLKVQLANLYGVDKISFEERVEFVDKNMDSIVDSAENPLQGKRWWLKADNPWQCLATCIELVAALRSPDPTKFESRLPIHMDGTCNGLQHYAALGGDVVGAKLVNLIPNDRPSDVYSGVAESVAKQVAQDAAQNHEIALKVNGLVSRKLIKQTVMTNTYGVTRIGARMQVQARLRDIQSAHQMNDSEMFKAAVYIVEKTFKAMGEMFEGARALQLWLNNSARLVASTVPADSLSETDILIAQWLSDRKLLPSVFSSESVEGPTAELDQEAAIELGGESLASLDSVVQDATSESVVQDSMVPAIEESLQRTEPTIIPEKHDPMKMTSVVWTSPLGLPVVQPYWNYGIRSVKTLLQNVSILDSKSPCPVDIRKQTTAFPPNFVHSLDASHMMMSAIACHAAGLEFAAVHDSYWTHASDIKQMNLIIRDCFVRLHKEDLMNRLREELLNRYSGHKLAVKVKLEGQDHADFVKFCKKNGIKKSRAIINTWVDFNLEQLPKKGLFNVDIVKNSKYFFH